MKARMLVWLVVCIGFILAMSVTTLPGWALGAAVAATLVLCIPLSVKRYRLERNLARMVWQILTTR